MTEQEAEEIALKKALTHGKVCIGAKNGMSVYVSYEELSKWGLKKCKSLMGLATRYPVFLDLSKNSVVWVEARSHQEAVDIVWKDLYGKEGST